MSKYLPANLPNYELTREKYQEIVNSKNRIVATCTSKRKGIAKQPVEFVELKVDHGIVGDAHAGSWHRQISLLNQDKVEDFKRRALEVPVGAFGENLLIDGYDVAHLPIGSRFIFAEVVLEMTQIGKECHFGCAIRDQVGDCIMPREGVFAVVIEPGLLKAGDSFRIELPAYVKIVDGSSSNSLAEVLDAVPTKDLGAMLDKSTKTAPAKNQELDVSKPSLTHINQRGEAEMVDVCDKDTTLRTAIASGKITMSPEAFDTLAKHSAKKGDVLAVARVAGIMGAKKTAELIPLCHSLALNKVSIDFDLSQTGSVVCRCLAKTSGRTGVEMEALTGCNIALLTIYDMLKAIDRSMTIGEIMLEKKSGGKSGEYHR